MQQSCVPDDLRQVRVEVAQDAIRISDGDLNMGPRTNRGPWKGGLTLLEYAPYGVKQVTPFALKCRNRPVEDCAIPPPQHQLFAIS